jgi:transposase
MARLLPPQNAAQDAVAREVGIGAATLERWREQAQSRPARGRAWTAGGRLEAVITTVAMSEAAKSAWCREHGAYPAGLDQWRAARVKVVVASVMQPSQ